MEKKRKIISIIIVLLILLGCTSYKRYYKENIVDLISDSKNYYYVVQEDEKYDLYDYKSKKLINHLDTKPEGVIKVDNEVQIIKADFHSVEVYDSNMNMLEDFGAHYVDKTDSSVIMFQYDISDAREDFQSGFNDEDKKKYQNEETTETKRFFTYPKGNEIQGITNYSYHYMNGQGYLIFTDSLNVISFYDKSLNKIRDFEPNEKLWYWGQVVNISQPNDHTIIADGKKFDLNEKKLGTLVNFKKINGIFYLMFYDQDMIKIIDQDFNVIDEVEADLKTSYDIFAVRHEVIIGTKKIDDKYWFLPKLDDYIKEQIIVRDSVYYEIYESYKDFEYVYRIFKDNVIIKSDNEPILLQLAAMDFKADSSIPLFIIANDDNVKLLNYKLDILQEYEGLLEDFANNGNSILLLIKDMKKDTTFMTLYEY